MSSSSSKSDSEMQKTLPQKKAEQNTNKPIDGKTAVGPINAEALFAWLGYKPNSHCEHGLLFYQCMECSH
jgi:hypothetical protein